MRIKFLKIGKKKREEEKKYEIYLAFVDNLSLIKKIKFSES